MNVLGILQKELEIHDGDSWNRLVQVRKDGPTAVGEELDFAFRYRDRLIREIGKAERGETDIATQDLVNEILKRNPEIAKEDGATPETPSENEQKRETAIGVQTDVRPTPRRAWRAIAACATLAAVAGAVMGVAALQLCPPLDTSARGYWSSEPDPVVSNVCDTTLRHFSGMIAQLIR